jgi:integrase
MGKPKKPALKSLPPTWREDMWERASQTDWQQSRPQLLPALALLWMTGCRPREIENGVRIYCRGDRIVIEVLGAKCVDAGTRERGQPKRRYGFVTKVEPGADEHPALGVLRGLAETNVVEGTGSVVVKHDSDYLYNSVVALGKAVYPTMRTRVSPYCFRHQAASDLKADPDVPLEEAAKFMGHLSDYSVGRYGRSVHGKRGGERVKPLVVTASRPVRHSPKVDRLARFKIASAKRRELKHKP